MMLLRITGLILKCWGGVFASNEAAFGERESINNAVMEICLGGRYIPR